MHCCLSLSLLSVGGNDARAWISRDEAPWRPSRKLASAASLSMVPFSKEPPVSHSKALKKQSLLTFQWEARKTELYCLGPIKSSKVPLHSHVSEVITHHTKFSLLLNSLKSSHLSPPPSQLCRLSQLLLILSSPLYSEAPETRYQPQRLLSGAWREDEEGG